LYNQTNKMQKAHYIQQFRNIVIDGQSQNLIWYVHHLSKKNKTT